MLAYPPTHLFSYWILVPALFSPIARPLYDKMYVLCSSVAQISGILQLRLVCICAYIRNTKAVGCGGASSGAGRWLSRRDMENPPWRSVPVKIDGS